ncbi:TPA: transposase, partial [Escherichia coli]
MNQKAKYTDEFKREAVSLVIEQGYTPGKAASSLGISDKTLQVWGRKVRDQNAGSLSDDERAELKQLRREVRELRTEKESLKKA